MKHLFIAVTLLLIMSCSSKKETTTFACPMQCEGKQVYQEKGNCPICKMDLEKQK